MAAALPDIMTRLKALVNGSYAPTRPIAAGRFTHVSFPAEGALPQSVKSPFPFDIVVGETATPDESPVTLASNQRWSETLLTVRVLYAGFLDAQFVREQTIARDVYALRRTLDDADSWNALTGLCGVTIGAIDKEPIQLVGDHNETQDTALMLTVPLVVTYREDHTS